MAEWQLLPRMDLHKKAVRRSDGSVSIATYTDPLTFLHGPHLRLDAGFYRIRVHCEAGRPRRPAQPVLGIEIIAQNRFHRGWRDFTAAELRDGYATLDFEVPPSIAMDHGIESAFEFRIMHLRNTGLTVHGIELQRIPSWEASLTPHTRWRLLGRLYPSWRQWARSPHVRIGRMTVTDALLWQCAPNLHLPAGSYRLDVNCRAGAVGDPARPVLRVRVETQHRVPIASRDFSAADLADGQGSIEFRVSDEFGVENGEHIHIEVRLSHFRNATLSVEAVDLHLLSRESEVSRSEFRAPATIRRRTEVLIIGNCQASLVAEAFRDNAFLSRQFRARHQWTELPANQHEQGKRELSECDILLVQDIHEWRDYPLREYLPDSVPLIRFPCLRFSSLWPFDAFSGPDDRQARHKDHPNFEFTYFDGLLGRLRKRIPDRNERFEAYRTLDIPGLIDYRRMHSFEERRLAAMDTTFGGAIGSFVLENFRTRRVFHTIAHPGREVLGMLLHQIAALLDIKRRLGRPRSLHELDRLQVPVHPIVARSLGVKWADERTKYLYRGEKITWETYIRRYIEYYG